ncbi:MAG: hypothetical protein R6V85_07395 [Polyangia bacterium]
MGAISALTAAAVAAETASEHDVSIELTVWKWVIISGVVAVAIIYAVKRISEVVVKRKTDGIIRRVVGGGDEGEGSEELEDLEKLDRELDEDHRA